jgi:biopolymer transport protein ExbD
MKNHRSHYLGAESKVRIEIIPMIDIMTFLLVFFMLATLSMVQGSGLKMICLSPRRRRRSKAQS